jgi:hypothetical protein
MSLVFSTAAARPQGSGAGGGEDHVHRRNVLEEARAIIVLEIGVASSAIYSDDAQ